MIEAADRQQMLEVADKARRAMEALARRARDLILTQPPIGFLGYILSQLHLALITGEQEKQTLSPVHHKSTLKTFQLILEYMHAIWSCYDNLPEESEPINEDNAREMMEIFSELDTQTMAYCMASAASRKYDGAGGHSADTEFHAKSSWSLIRGHRYQVLEEEFFRFALEPHADALREAYGFDHIQIAAGIQRISDTFRTGVSRAAEQLHEAMDRTHATAETSGQSIKSVLSDLRDKDPHHAEEIGHYIKDMLFGGICNLSRHSGLPAALLDDLSYNPGENSQFFAEGEFAGTPMRSLPARSKPGIRLGGDVYATDGQFVRDSAYRAIQWGLWKRLPYRDEWLTRQGKRVEEAYPLIFSQQMRGADSYESVYFKDVASGEWVESDLLLIVDDVLLVIESKAGVMPMHSPATNFANHERVINELIVKAYIQCARFIQYLASAPEVPLFSLNDGVYVEIGRIRRSRFRVILPIGLTIEAFTPFSAMAKELEGIVPILDEYPFISMSVDDLFVLNRFLPTTGQLLHYLYVRQQVAGIPNAMLFDEIDHLGAYLSRNRFDIDLREQLKEATLVTWDAFSDTVDRHFEHEDWSVRPVPSQSIPPTLERLLEALDRFRPQGWLRIDTHLRDFGHEGRENLAALVDQLEPSLCEHPRRRFVIASDTPLQVWLCRSGQEPTAAEITYQAQVISAVAKANMTEVVIISYRRPGEIAGIQLRVSKAASVLQANFADVKAEARNQERKLRVRKQARQESRRK